MSVKEHAAGNRVNFFGSIIKFFKDVKAEFKKITWPSKDDAINSTVTVLVVVVVFTLVLWALDSIFGFTLRSVLNNLK